MVAVEILDVAEHRVVGPGGAVEEHADRERDRDRDAAEHAEDEDAAERDEREADLGGADVAEAPDRPDVDQPGGGDDDHHAERRLGQRLDQRHQEEEEQPDDDGRDQGGGLGPAPVESLTADREFDEETGKALGQAAERFAVPRAVSSRLASTS